MELGLGRAEITLSGDPPPEVKKMMVNIIIIISTMTITVVDYFKIGWQWVSVVFLAVMLLVVIRTICEIKVYIQSVRDFP